MSYLLFNHKIWIFSQNWKDKYEQYQKCSQRENWRSPWLPYPGKVLEADDNL